MNVSTPIIANLEILFGQTHIIPTLALAYTLIPTHPGQSQPLTEEEIALVNSILRAVSYRIRHSSIPYPLFNLAFDSIRQTQEFLSFLNPNATRDAE